MVYASNKVCEHNPDIEVPYFIAELRISLADAGNASNAVIKNQNKLKHTGTFQIS